METHFSILKVFSEEGGMLKGEVNGLFVAMRDSNVYTAT